jgi:deazaflavin-dependent oxidoreductase (nitroreductase family)
MTRSTLHEIEERAVDGSSLWAQRHIQQYLATDGAEVDHPSSDRLILLYTTGRRSGRIRRVPVVHFPAGHDLLVVGSKGGSPNHPEWYLNLVADPRVWVRYKDDFFEARAAVLTPEERAAEWPKITALSPGFADYQAKVDRVIPVVRLTRI